MYGRLEYEKIKQPNKNCHIKTEAYVFIKSTI